MTETVYVTTDQTALAVSTSSVAEYVSTSAGFGVAVSVTDGVVKGAPVGLDFAHSLHTLPAVVAAHQDRVGLPSGESKSQGGQPLVSKLGLGKIEAGKHGFQVSLRMLWVPYRVTRKTRVDDGHHLRAPLLRGDEARFKFGRGKWSHKWELTIQEFLEVPYAEVQTVISRRRY